MRTFVTKVRMRHAVRENLNIFCINKKVQILKYYANHFIIQRDTEQQKLL